MKKEWMERAGKALKKYQYVLLVLLVGVLLLLWPAGEEPRAAESLQEETQDPFQIGSLEARLEAALSQVEGAGEVTVVLTLRESPQAMPLQDLRESGEGSGQSRESSAVLLSRGSGGQELAVLQQLGPEYRGALVVSPGGDDPRVRLALSNAISALTGLGADKITICKGK